MAHVKYTSTHTKLKQMCQGALISKLLECLEGMECLFVRAAGSGEKKSKRPFSVQRPKPLLSDSSLSLPPPHPRPSTDRVQRSDLLLLQHRGSVHPLPSRGLPEAGLPGDQGMHPGSPPLPEREPAAGGSRRSFMATASLM